MRTNRNPAEQPTVRGWNYRVACPALVIALSWSAILLTCAAVGEGSHQDHVTVRIASPNITAAFDYQVDDYTVSFHDKFTGILIRWSWSLGDQSGPSHVRNPVHEYTARGRFQVQLRVEDETGIVAEAIRQIHIADPADTRSYTVAVGAGLLMIGVVLLTKGTDNGQLVGFIILLAAIATMSTLAFHQDFAGRLIAFFDGLWRAL